MLQAHELEVLRANGRIHTQIFEAIRKEAKIGTRASDLDKLAVTMCIDAGVLPSFTGVYGYKYAIQTSVNDVVVHGRPLSSIIFQEGDVVTFDFGVKDKKYGVCTDAAFTMIIGEKKHEKKEHFLEVGKNALKKAMKQAHAGKRVGDIGYAIQSYVESEGYHIIKDLSGHGIGKKLHEEPYIYNYGKAGTGPLLKEGMTICIEPILGYSSGEIVDQGDWEIYVADGSLGCQFEHTLLITTGDPEIIA